MIIAIHQPNYAPWLGYFHKIARADEFVFLDDVQFSKGSYINRVRIGYGGTPRWLTQPVSVRLGMAINAVALARSDWAQGHLDTLRGAYKDASSFSAVWRDIESIYTDLPDGNLACVNRALIEALAVRLGISATFRCSSAVNTGAAAGDKRLAAIVTAVAPGGTYLSGSGGSKYQSPETFASAGIGLRYAAFEHPEYDQGDTCFEKGLSILDAIFHLGWDRTAALLRG